MRNAIVTLIDPQGNARTATMSSFGFYTFADVPTGLTYTIRVSSRRYRFASLEITVNGDMMNVDFVGSE